MAKIVYINSHYEGKIELDKKSLGYLSSLKIKSLALFSSIQFLKLNKLKNQLNSVGIKIVNSSHQVLGCDLSINQSVFDKCDFILYVGDGSFHPKAILLSQLGNKLKDVLCFNPMTKNISKKNFKDIESELLKQKSNLNKFFHSKKMGILISTKPGQANIEESLKLKKELESQDKKVFLFVDNYFDFNNIENFNFIDLWVNTACPRIGVEDLNKISKPLLNIREARQPIKYLEIINKTFELNGKAIN